MKKPRLLGAMRILIPLFLITFASQAVSTTLTQQFSSSWTISPWDYYGDVAAMKWHYLPYQPWDQALGTLTSVEVHTTIEGSREDTNENVRIRYAFVTGWNPADYQFSRTFYLASGTQIFSHNESYSFTSAADLANWGAYQYYPPANYYFESRTVTAAHTISATTTLTFTYTPHPTSITIDIYPNKKSDNVLNPKKKNINVAILGSTTFDALQVDPETIKFGPGEASSIRFKGRDYNHDGYADLTLTFNLDETGIVCGDTDASLSGATYAGDAIQGTDVFTIKGCKIITN